MVSLHKIYKSRKKISSNSSFTSLSRIKAFEREIELPKLIGLWPSDLRDYSAEGTAKLISLLRKALRIERQRGRSGHWTYDLNRHLALCEALQIEKARLRELEGMGISLAAQKERASALAAHQKQRRPTKHLNENAILSEVQSFCRASGNRFPVRKCDKTRLWSIFSDSD